MDVIDNDGLHVDSDHSFGAVGRTRCGKTTLMQHLLKQQPRVIVVDTKHDDPWKGYHLTMDSEAALSADVDRIVYRVPEGEKVPNEWWPRAMRVLHTKGGGVIYIDELPMITGPNFIPSGLADVFRIGNGLGVGVWWSAQESTGISNTALRQSRVLCLFNNHGASDRDKLIGTVGDMGEVTRDLDRFEFVVYRSDGAYRPDEIDIWRVPENAL